MSDNKNYIGWLRSKVGHEKIMLVHAGGCIFNEKGEVVVKNQYDFAKNFKNGKEKNRFISKRFFCVDL